MERLSSPRNAQDHAPNTILLTIDRKMKSLRQIALVSQIENAYRGITSAHVQITYTGIQTLLK